MRLTSHMMSSPQLNDQELFESVQRHEMGIFVCKGPNYEKKHF